MKYDSRNSHQPARRPLRTCLRSRSRDAAQGKSSRKSGAYTQYVSILRMLLTPRCALQRDLKQVLKNSIKNGLFLGTFVAVLSLGACFDSNTEAPPPSKKPTEVPIPPGDLIKTGQSYFVENCAVCHGAGNDDKTTAFNASDLALRRNPITTDLSGYGGTYRLMGAFSKLSPDTAAALQAYFNSL